MSVSTGRLDVTWTNCLPPFCTTDSVNADFDLWSPLSARTGFHDVHNPMVYAAWMRCTGLMNPNPRTFALWKETDGHGIGVVMT